MTRKVVHFPTLDEALELHRRLIARFGGAPGVLDLGLLESALYRPRTGYYSDLAHMAAALLESLLLNHAFVDGNKSVAFFITDVFVRMNGFCLQVKPRAAHRLLIAYVESKPRQLSDLREWITANLRPLDAQA